MSMTGPRVLFLIDNVPYSLDTRVRREAHVVQGIGGRAMVICPSDGGRWHSLIDGVDVYQYPKPRLGRGFAAHLFEYIVSLFFHIPLTAYIFARHGFDVIHGANPPDIFWIVAAPYKLCGKSYIFDHHDLVPELFQNRFGERFRALQTVVLWMEKCGMRLADHVISTNESFKSVALTRGGKTPSEVTVVRNGPWLERDFPSVQPDVRVRELGKVVVGYLGIMNPQDHLENLLEAARIIHFDLERDDIGFIMIGSGDSYRSLLDMRDNLGLHDVVRMPGTLPWNEVLASLSAVDICVQPDLPSSFNVHLTMNKLMEYMALGKPTIAYDMHETRVTGGDATIFLDGDTAMPLANAIVELADNPNERMRLGEKAKNRVHSMLAWEKQREALACIYKELMLSKVPAAKSAE